MADKPTTTATQVVMTDGEGAIISTQPLGAAPVAHPAAGPAQGQPQAPGALYSEAGPLPHGIQHPANAHSSAETLGVGVEGEVDVWDGYYSYKNFVGRGVFAGLLAVAWIALATFTWGYAHDNPSGWNFIAITAGIVLLVYLLILTSRLIRARIGHHYRLTNRRLFVSTGIMRRRRDQMELLRVQDVHTKQTFSQRWLSLGTVVIITSEKHLPIINLPGVDDPKTVMDLIWHHARAERDNRSVKVDQI